jgi:hypothetical protein
MTSQLVLLNIGHHKRNPVCSRAAFRILGVFADVREIELHLASADLKHSDVDVHAVSLGQWFVIMRDKGENEAAHLDSIRSRHKLRLQQHAEEFEANRSQQRTGQVSQGVSHALEAAPEADQADRDPVMPIRPNSEVRMQHFAVVSVLHDHAEPVPDEQQPGVCIWAVFDTEKEALAHVRENLSKKVFEYHLDIVALYEWLFPTNVDLSQLEEEYRTPELDEIMRHRKKEKENVENFRRLCEQRNEVVPEIVIGSDHTPQPVMTLTAGDDAVVERLN